MPILKLSKCHFAGAIAIVLPYEEWVPINDGHDAIWFMGLIELFTPNEDSPSEIYLFPDVLGVYRQAALLLLSPEVFDLITNAKQEEMFSERTIDISDNQHEHIKRMIRIYLKSLESI